MRNLDFLLNNEPNAAVQLENTEQVISTDRFRELHITNYAFDKAFTYATLVCDNIGAIECGGYLITPKGSQDRVVRDIFLARDQEVSGGEYRLDGGQVTKAGGEIDSMGYKVLGWWHSHHELGLHSHSSIDDNNQMIVLNCLAPTNYILEKVERLYPNLEIKADGKQVTFIDRNNPSRSFEINVPADPKELATARLKITEEKKVGFAYSFLVHSDTTSRFLGFGRKPRKGRNSSKSHCLYYQETEEEIEEREEREFRERSRREEPERDFLDDIADALTGNLTGLPAKLEKTSPKPFIEEETFGEKETGFTKSEPKRISVARVPYAEIATRKPLGQGNYHDSSRVVGIKQFDEGPFILDKEAMLKEIKERVKRREYHFFGGSGTTGSGKVNYAGYKSEGKPHQTRSWLQPLDAIAHPTIDVPKETKSDIPPIPGQFYPPSIPANVPPVITPNKTKSKNGKKSGGNGNGSA